jgi:histidyl-tRNA synthetase
MYAPDEAAMNQVLIKNMKTGEQTIINNDDLQNEITKLIKK